MPSVPMPWYLQVFQWSSWISTVIFPLAAIGAALFLFLIWREARRYVRHLMGEVQPASGGATEEAVKVKEMME